MKYVTACLAFVLLSSGLRAQYEDQALERALESRFSSVLSTSSVNYTETDQTLCQLRAEFWAKAIRYGSRQAQFYDCSVCLYADDNLFWDYESITCDFSAH